MTSRRLGYGTLSGIFVGLALIAAAFADLHISAAEGSIGAFPRRLQVAAEDWAQARRVLIEAGLQAWVVHDGAVPP